MSQAHSPGKEGETAPPSAPLNSERRLSVRYTIGRDATCSSPMTWSNEGWGAWIHDLSEAGIGVILLRRFEVGATLYIQVPGLSENATRTLLARVANVRPYRKKSWLVGCTLMTPLAEAELRELIQTGLPPLDDPSTDPEDQD